MGKLGQEIARSIPGVDAVVNRDEIATTPSPNADLVLQGIFSAGYNLSAKETRSSRREHRPRRFMPSLAGTGLDVVNYGLCLAILTFNVPLGITYAVASKLAIQNFSRRI